MTLGPGFCDRSESGRFCRRKPNSAWGGFPMNTNGGGLSCTPGHVRDISSYRGSAPVAPQCSGKRQVANASRRGLRNRRHAVQQVLPFFPGLIHGDKPLPVIDHDSVPFWDTLQEQRSAHQAVLPAARSAIYPRARICHFQARRMGGCQRVSERSTPSRWLAAVRASHSGCGAVRHWH